MSKPNQEINASIPLEIIEELLTPSEIKMIKQRVRIFEFIALGKSIREIATKVGVGTDTVVRMIRKIEKSQILQEKYLKRESSSKWVFGQIGSEEI